MQRLAAERIVATAHGTALLSPSIRQVYDHNYLSVEHAEVPPEVLAAEADGAMDDCFHRRVVVEDGTPGLADEFVALGYVRSTHLVLVHEREPDRRVDTAMVRELALDELLPARAEATLREPWGDAEIAAELNESKRHVAAAVPTRFFGALAGGEVAGWCELRVGDGIAQIEDVEVLAEFRGRGLGRALAQHALDEGLRAVDTVFLEALADDWPRELYAKLGFVAAGRRDVYTKLPDPLTRIRLRTPRLELRLATAAEIHRLYRVAEEGIHDPAYMPFSVPWTDDLDEAGFFAHVSAIDPDELRFVAFLDGEPIGVQAIHVQPEHVGTGSWLGRRYQGRGLGTEMRAAVLTYAFTCLQATAVRSSAMVDNARSLGVSRKLGYRLVGSDVVAPRGEPVEHLELELTADRFVSPVPVEIVARV